MTHTYFSGWGSYAVTGGCVHAQATPSPKGVTTVPHLLQPSGLHTRGIPSHCSPRCATRLPTALQSVCQAPACWWREGLKTRTCRPTAGSAPSRLVTSPRRHSSPSRPTSQTASPWAAQWACGSSQLEFDQQSSQPHHHKDPKRSSLVVRCPVLQTNCSLLGRAMGSWVIAEGV